MKCPIYFYSAGTVWKFYLLHSAPGYQVLYTWIGSLNTKERREVEGKRRDYHICEGLSLKRDKGLDQGYGCSPGQSWEQSLVCWKCWEMVSLSCYLSVYLPFVFRLWTSARTSRYVLPLQNIFNLCLHYQRVSPRSAQHCMNKRGLLTPEVYSHGGQKHQLLRLSSVSAVLACPRQHQHNEGLTTEASKSFHSTH